MINMAYEDIITKIKEKSDIGNEELTNKINKKMEQLSGLISKEGAAYIVANDLGVKLVQSEGMVKIKDVVAGQRNVETAGGAVFRGGHRKSLKPIRKMSSRRRKRIPFRITSTESGSFTERMVTTAASLT